MSVKSYLISSSISIEVTFTFNLPDVELSCNDTINVTSSLCDPAQYGVKLISNGCTTPAVVASTSITDNELLTF